MSSLRQLARDFAQEAHSDYVGLWQIVRAVREAAPDTDDRGLRDASLALVALLLERGLVLGQFRAVSADSAPDFLFEPWTEPRDAALERIRVEWTALGRDPDIGEIAWLVAPTEEAG